MQIRARGKEAHIQLATRVKAEGGKKTLAKCETKKKTCRGGGRSRGKKKDMSPIYREENELRKCTFGVSKDEDEKRDI